MTSHTPSPLAQGAFSKPSPKEPSFPLTARDREPAPPVVYETPQSALSSAVRTLSSRLSEDTLVATPRRTPSRTPMAQNNQQSALPTFYGEKTPDGKTVERPTSAGKEPASASIPPPEDAHLQSAEGHTSTGNVSTIGPLASQRHPVDYDPEDRSRLTPRKNSDVPPWNGRYIEGRRSFDDFGPRSYDYGYPEPRRRYDRDRWELERERDRWDRERDFRDFYPEYRGPQRYSFAGTEPPWFDDTRTRAGGVSRYASGRETNRGPLSARGKRSFDEAPRDYPRKMRSYEMDEERDVEEEDPFGGDNGGGNGKRPPRPPPRMSSEEVLRVPFTMWMSSAAKNRMSNDSVMAWTQKLISRTDFVATVGEFIGTTMFLFFAFAGTQVGQDLL